MINALDLALAYGAAEGFNKNRSRRAVMRHAFLFMKNGIRLAACNAKMHGKPSRGGYNKPRVSYIVTNTTANCSMDRCGFHKPQVNEVRTRQIMVYIGSVHQA